MSVTAFLAIPVVVILRLAGLYHVSGIASIHILVLLVGGIQLLFLGMLGEYLARDYDETKRRPVYVLGDAAGSRRRWMRPSTRSYFEIEGRHWWFLGRRRLFLRLIEDRFGARRPIDMLDFGCGTGAFLEHLERFGAVSAVDSDASAVAFCHTRGRTEVQLVPADAPLPFPDASFDLATTLDVVEHIDDDVAALAELRRVLRPDGVLLVAVPAFMFLWGKQDEVSHHKRRYTARTLRAALHHAGFAVERTSYFNTLLFPPIAAVRVGRRLLRRPGSAAERLRPRPGDAQPRAGRGVRRRGGHRRAPQPAVRRVGARAGAAAMTAPVREAIRFATVGVLQNGLNVAVFALATAVGVQYRVAAVLAGLVALVASFLLNRQWTFTSRTAPIHHQGLRYLIVFASAVALGVVLLTFFVEVAGLPEVLAQVAAILVVAPVSFLVQRSWVFRAPRRSAAPRG